jgi:predicted DCC family thiol-disulfide oxidoreductase YuxK
LKIVFYDGECGLCQRSIRLLVKLDKNKIFFYAPINGATYEKIYSHVATNVSSVIFYDGGTSYYKSEAFLEICKIIGGILNCFRIIEIIPLALRDYFYSLIAARRKNITCVVLLKDEKFLK